MILELTNILTNEPRHATFLRQEVQLLLEHLSVNAKDIKRAQLVLSEAFSNIILHAYDAADQICIVKLQLADGVFRMVIQDRGRGFLESVKADLPSTWHEGGRGMFLIRRLSDNVQIESIPGKETDVTIEIQIGLG